MTLRQLFEATLIELSKMQAPTLKLYEFNYLCNKAIGQYVNKIYNIYSTNQQSDDDLRVLKSTCNLTPLEKDGIYEVNIPMDYLHLLNCICVFNDSVCDKQKCVSATRLTSDSWSQIIQDVYNKPSIDKPYYYIHNVNSQVELPTNPIDQNGNGTDTSEFYSNFPRTITLKFGNNTYEQSLVHKPTTSRIGNVSKIRCEIRCGNNKRYKLNNVSIDYLKVPQHVCLTQDQVDLVEDTSQIMEFPDYVNQEIINELVHLVMEKTNDPRLSNHTQITQTIARPTGQQ